MYTSKSPTLNVHGETRDTVVFVLNDFINDNYKMGIEYIGVIHGYSSTILKTKVHELLKKNKYVDSYKTDLFNPGLTIIKLKKRPK